MTKSSKGIPPAMRSNRKLLFGIALVLAAIVFWRIYAVFSNSTPPPANNVATNPASGQAGMTPVAARGRLVAVATQDIPDGSLIAPGMFEMRQLPGATSTEDYITDQRKILGYITRVPLKPGDRMHPEDFIGHISEVGIAGALRPGYRAMMVPIGNKPTLHDLVKIGNYVDIMGAFEGQESRNIVENVRVMAVDVQGTDYPPTSVAMRGPFKAEPKGGVAPGTPEPAPGAAPGPTPTPTPAPANPAPPAAALTIEVTPQQANALLLTQAAGAVYDFVLRSPSDSAVQPGTTAETATPATTVSVTRPQIAPYSTRLKQTGGGAKPDANMRTAKEGLGEFRKGMEALRDAQWGKPGSGSGTGPAFPPAGSEGGRGIGTPPLPVAQPAPPATYDIPIYADGKLARVDTVRNPTAPAGVPGQ